MTKTATNTISTTLLSNKLGLFSYLFCILICLSYWMPEAPPYLYAFIETLLPYLDPFSNLRGGQALDPTDFVH